MKRLLVFVFLIFRCLQADPIGLRGSDNPSVFEHVNVITGSLSLAKCDAVAQGAKPLNLIRRYIEGQWIIFSEAYLFIEPKFGSFAASVFEADGAVSIYAAQSSENGEFHFSPVLQNGSFLSLSLEQSSAVLSLPNRSSRIYKKFDISEPITGYYLLAEETLSDGHHFVYSYDAQGHLAKIESKNPQKTKTWTGIDFEIGDCSLIARTFDKTSVEYSFLPQARGGSLCSAKTKDLLETFEYDPVSRLLTSWTFGDNHIRVSYEDLKVQTIEITSKTESRFAEFTYLDNQTDVKCANGLLKRYRHDGSKILSIDEFDETRSLVRSERFFWDSSGLKCRAVYGPQGGAVAAATFSYDTSHNLIETAIWGNLTGLASPVFFINEKGDPQGTESFKKNYRYDPHSSLIREESEENGLVYRYEYKDQTNLLASKQTCNGSQTLIREFFFYDEDNLPSSEILDDGSAQDPFNTIGISTRLIRRFENDPKTGRRMSETELFFDTETGREIRLKTNRYRYSPEGRLVEQTLEDAKGEKRYGIQIDYDAQGCILRQTDSFGRTNFTTSQSVPIAPLSCQDAFDVFGRPKKRTFASMKDEAGNTHSPSQTFSYDLLNHLTEVKSSDGSIHSTLYNVRGSPIESRSPSGTKTRMFYSKNGCLEKIIYPDQSATYFTSDFFQRVVKKQMRSPSQNLLCEENFSYDALHLLCSTNDQGKTTSFRYDGAGRKIEEISEGISKIFTYDSLGFIEKTSDGSVTLVQIHNPLGQVIKEWRERPDGSKDNLVLFSYDLQGRKTKVEKASTGAIDTTVYDAKGRIVQHTDPLGSTTCFSYEELTDEFGQPFLKKIILDPLGRKRVETYDTANRLIALEKIASNGTTLCKEHRSYSPFGNLIKRTFDAYRNGCLSTTFAVVFCYDSEGRLVRSTENDRKITEFSYDIQGRLVQKVLPNKTALFYQYDDLGRLVELKSSDRTIFHRYEYSLGKDPIRIDDLISGLTLHRSFDRSGRLLRETNGFGLTYSWTYDSLGRKTSFHLPDSSSISYRYANSHLSSIERIDSSGLVQYSHRYHFTDPSGKTFEETPIFSQMPAKTTKDLLSRPVSYASNWQNQTIRYDMGGRVESSCDSMGSCHYEHDGLDQLICDQSFDSMEHPVEAKIGSCGELLECSNFQQIFDANGCLIERHSKDETTQYEYDALSRLVAIVSPGKKKTAYIYDPLSRLLAKDTFAWQENGWNQTNRQFYLYDHDVEIGIASSDRSISQLKVLGTGSKKDIGATIALEIGKETLMPLHDFFGNIIGAVNAQGEQKHFNPIEPFGQNAKDAYLPWNFCSKRFEEGLIFFGHRFYDPETRRWLTPDPGGFVDGPNLYAFVHNNPLSRFDASGLASDAPVRIELPIATLAEELDQRRVLHCPGFIGDASVDWVVSCGFWNRIHFTSEELESGIVNIADHLEDLTPHTGQKIGLITYQNGINTTLKKFITSCESISHKTSEGTLLIGLHNKTNGFCWDVVRMMKEISASETPLVQQTRQFMSSFVSRLHDINPEVLWAQILHSEGGAVARRAIEGMTDYCKDLLKQHLYVYALGPVLSIPHQYAYQAVNVYSNFDLFGLAGSLLGLGGYKLKSCIMGNGDCNIELLPSSSGWLECTLCLIDHAFLGGTYNSALDGQLAKWRERYGLHSGQNR